MSTFWGFYVALLTLGTLLAVTWLIFATRKGQRPDNTDQTVGHSFDGIEEYDNPLPRWWFLLFVGTLIFAFGYLLLYPGLGNFRGCCPATATAGRKSPNGSARWPSPMPVTARCSPRTPPCPSPTWPRTSGR